MVQKQPLEVFYKKSCFWKFRNIYRKTPVLESFFDNFIKKGTPTQIFSCEYCEIFKNTFFEEHLRTAAFDGGSTWNLIFVLVRANPLKKTEEGAWRQRCQLILIYLRETSTRSVDRDLVFRIRVLPFRIWYSGISFSAVPPFLVLL